MAIAVWAGYPRSYSKGRTRPVQYVVIHYTAGSEGPTSAESGAAYDKVRTDGTSTHCFADSNSVVREVPDADRAHAARYHGNEIGLQLELCGTAQTRARWLDVASSATLRLAAKQTAEWCKAHDLPVRRLSVEQTRAAYYAPAGQRPKGIVGHVDCTNAYPEDSGDHQDPGPEFPWDVFLAMVHEEMEGDDMFDKAGYIDALRDPTVVAQLRALPLTYPVTPTKSLLTLYLEMAAKVDLIATKVDIDPAELAAIEEAAAEGAKTGALASADALAAAVVAALPTDMGLTAADVEAAVREAFAGGLAPDVA